MCGFFALQSCLTAQFLPSDPKGNRAAQALRMYLRGEDWWKEVVEFYVISRDDPRSVDEWMGRISRGMPNQLVETRVAWPADLSN